MDNSRCPATPLVLTEAESKSPLRMAASSPESDGMKSPSSDSPDPQCVICLGKLQNKSFTDSCLHQFCFQCLLQWSKVKPECPLCKQPFKSIINNVRSNLDYDQYPVEPGEPRCVLSDFMHSFNFDFIQVDRRFRYRSTMTREYFRDLAESILARNRLISNDFYQIPPIVPVDPAPAHNTRSSSRLTNSVRHQGTTEFRRSIYSRDLWVQDLADISGRYRECTPQFYRDNPAQIHRIVPWLNREVNVLLNDCESHTAYILSRIVSHLSQHPIRSREFRELVEPYFGPRTDHFIHELYTFAHSVYDITGFDQHAVYRPNPNYATEVQEINSSNDDSDIEIVETVKCKEKKLRTSSKDGFKSILLKRSPRMVSQTDEPVAGPSGVYSSSKPLEISESDPEEIKILDYVKPEPEVVTLSSGEDVPPVFCDSNASGDEECVVVVGSDKNEKSDEDYVSLCEKVRNRCGKSSKGKCKTNGFGLKGKQKQKYMKRARRRRSSSADSTRSFCSDGSSTSSSSSSSTSSSSSSSSSDRKSRRKKTKTSRKSKSKKKITSKSSNKSQKSKRRNSNDSSGGDTVDENSSKTKKRVKSCVIVPNSNSCDSFHVQKISEGDGFERDHRYPASYWSFSLSNAMKEVSSQRRRRKPTERKWKRERIGVNSTEEKTEKRGKIVVDSSSDEPLASRLKRSDWSRASTKESRGSSSVSRSKKTKMDDSPTVERDSQCENSPYTHVIGHCETSYGPGTSSSLSPSEASRDSTATNVEPNFS